MKKVKKTMDIQSADVLLNQLNWEANNGGDRQLGMLRVDVYEFRFDEPLKDRGMSRFIEFLRNEPMDKLSTMAIIWMWLWQHSIGFKLKFSWNWNLSVVHNLKNLRGPAKLNSYMKDYIRRNGVKQNAAE